MTERKKLTIVSNWIFLGVSMLLIQVLIGGITRLTGSGLSITEWKPILGILPPLSEDAWNTAFTQYKKIAQYKYLNSHFTLSNFKFIFFWEWFHRLWARLIGVVFLIPFFFFLIKGYFKSWMINPLIILFLLGILQGAIGWIMVKSGLNDENLYVNHIRLAIHFIAAMLLIGYTLTFGLMIRIPDKERIVNKPLKYFTLIIIGIISLQLFYGALMAGLKAASAAPTWPSINRMIIPDVIFRGSIIESLYFNKLTIHFIHRGLAYLILLLVIIWFNKVKAIQPNAFISRIKIVTLIIISTQVALGIGSVLLSPTIVLGKFGNFEITALFHQLIGMLLFLTFIVNVYLLKLK